MRTVFITQWFDPEPGAIRGLPLARELVRRGRDIEVLTGFPNYPGGKVYPGYKLSLYQRQMMDGVLVTRVGLYPSHGTNPLGRVANYGSFALSASMLGPALVRRGDVGYVYHPPPTVGLPGFAFRAIHRMPFVYHIADMWPESVVESGMLGRGRVKQAANLVLGEYCKWVYRRAAAITVLSPGFKRLLTERGVPESKVKVVYNWADDDMFHPMDRDEALAAELGLQGKFNVIYAGNFGTFQSLNTVIRAAKRLIHIADLQVVLVGTGTEEPALKALAASIGATNVRFVGRRDMTDMPKINVLADVLLIHLQDLPFFRATIPSKTQVSLASGRPILMAVAGDAASVVERSKSGLVAPPGDDEAMAKAIADFHEMGAEGREQLGKQGREYYLEHMCLKVGADAMDEIFAEVGRNGSIL